MDCESLLSQLQQHEELSEPPTNNTNTTNSALLTNPLNLIRLPRRHRVRFFERIEKSESRVVREAGTAIII